MPGRGLNFNTRTSVQPTLVVRPTTPRRRPGAARPEQSAAQCAGGRTLLSAFLSAFRTPDLRKKLIFTLGIIAVYRLGATLPSPGVSFANV